MQQLKFCESLFTYRRRPTHEVKVGDIGIGGNNPIRIQSMTISDTMDTDATVAEVIQLVEAGCEIVRITAPSLNEAKNLQHIKAKLRKEGINVPLVADIHYTPNAALIAAEFVEKVRINPGNYADKKKFEVREYTDAEYAAELDRIRDRFAPLVLKCKQNGVAMRIGVNHGSLSDRIMNRYGDTPEGMVQSALEFIRICEDFGYRDIVVSMKSSNPQVMIQAYRLLAARMNEFGMTYPLHLGVTEAGDGEDGRTKSAVGIGALLEDGIGDTIRVSLTEDAVHEIPVARALVHKYNAAQAGRRSSVQPEGPIDPADPPGDERSDELEYLLAYPPFSTQRRRSLHVDVKGAAAGEGEPVRVAIDSALLNRTSPVTAGPARPSTDGRSLPVLNTAPPRDESRPRQAADPSKYRRPADQSVEWLFSENGTACAHHLAHLPVIRWSADRPADAVRQKDTDGPVYFEFEPFSAGRWINKRTCRQAAESMPPVGGCPDDDAVARVAQVRDVIPENRMLLGIRVPVNTIGALSAVRRVLLAIHRHRLRAPLVLHYHVPEGYSDWKLDAAATLGSLLCNGIGDAVYFSGDVEAGDAVTFAYTLLQATRTRISKTDFISCPSCGRTLFNLQTTTERIKSKTAHLKGVKIAIMGCIVNGPGEMADADFGYVGAGPGKVNLFVGKTCVQRNIPEEEADARLIALIKEHGKWVEPSEKTPA